ncbi:MAG: phosphatase PAP2 family protein [Gemmatimonadota bacterium]|nr:MAG: phosphatase PAP2 family protein [Gemmatimonadota bacterium]
MSDTFGMRRLLPVDWVVAAYNLILAVIWLTQLNRVWFALILAGAHLAGLVLLWLLARAPENLSEPVTTIREIYPLLFLAVFWPELDVVRPVLALQSNDAAIAALDLFVFRVALHAVWMPNMSALWFSELMYLSYECYYLLVFLPPIVLLFQKRRPALRDTTFRLALVYLICFVTYAVFPVDGPHFLQEPFQGPHTSGFFYGINQILQASGDSLGCSFPSSHVAAAVSAAYIGWKYFPRWVAILMSLEALGVTLSTTYTQNHYAIDSLAGLVLALVVQLWLVPVLYRRFGVVTDPTGGLAAGQG